MAEFTDHLNLYKPGGGATGAITPDEVVDIDRVNANMDAIDAAIEVLDDFRVAQDGRNQQYRGVAANIGSVSGMVRGDTYQETDGDFRFWRYDGTNWLSSEGGMFLIRPASVSGTGLSIVNGSVVCTAMPTAGGHVEGVFSSRFRNYLIVSDGTFNVASALQLQLRVGGSTAAGASDYINQYIYANGAAAVITAQNSIALFSLSGVGGFRMSGTQHLYKPGIAVETEYTSECASVNGATVAHSRIGATHIQPTAYTGFTLTTTSSGIFTGQLRIYGIA